MVEIVFDVRALCNLEMYTDKEWAGDQDTRRSTNAGCLKWTTLQQVAKSSTEVELGAAYRTAFGGIPTCSLSAD